MTPDQRIINEKLDVITTYLFNDRNTNRKGLIQKVDELELIMAKIQTDSKVKKAKTGVYLSVLAVIAGFTGGLLKAWIESHIK